MDVRPIPFRDTEGGRQVDTEHACSACHGECPCPQACERREDAAASEKTRACVLPKLLALVCGGRS